MRKIIIGVLILIACVFSFYLYSYGFSSISSMAALQEQKMAYDEKVTEVESEKERFNESKENLIIALNNYTDSKTQYEQVTQYTSTEAQEQAALGDYYDLEYLWTIIGTHAIRENVELGLVCTTSPTPSENEDYIYADLNFTVDGEYRPISDFIERCEDDESLEFSISHFKLVPYEPKTSEEEITRANYLTATFVVQDVPLSLETLELINNQVEDSREGQSSLSEDLEAIGDFEGETNTTSENTTSNETNTTSESSNNTTTNETNTTSNEPR